MNYEKQSKDIIINILDKLKKSAIKNTGISRGAYHFSSELAKDNEKLKLLVYFGKKGSKIVLQGSEGASLYGIVKKEVYGEETLFAPAAADITEPEEYIGSDESGKGDIFGPLVVAAVYINPGLRDKLKNLDIKDSKLLSDDKIASLALEIKSLLKDEFNIICLPPPEYNKEYDAYGNLNLLLAKLHSEAIKGLIKNHKTSIILIDKFADEKLILNHFNGVAEENREIIQVPKAEKYPAVAAASILARNEFVNWFKENEKYGLNLPKGASLNTQDVFKKMKSKGMDLSKYAKMHFKINLNKT